MQTRQPTPSMIPGPLITLLSFLALLLLLAGPRPCWSQAASSPVLLYNTFTDGNDAGWTQINRYWHVWHGRYSLDGGYRSDAASRDGFSVTHVGDQTWRNYLFEALFDNINPAGRPSVDVHNVFLFVRVQAPPPNGTFYRIQVWPRWTTDPRGRPGRIPAGLVQLEKFENGNLTAYVFNENSNSVAGTNEIAVSAIGGKIDIWINGQNVLTYTDKIPLLYGGVGIGAIWEAQAWFDNIKVTAVQ